ncbi:MAG: nicotinate-nucleotide adenylyltransferase [Acidobacteriota bacterium]
MGGSFDPVHNAHMGMARLALERLGLEEIHFLPVFRPPHKMERPLSAEHQRYAMLVLATQPELRFKVSSEELTRERPSYTIDTLKRLRETESSRRWYFLAGADTFAEIETWKQARSVLELVDFIVFPRNGITLAEMMKRLPDWANRRLIEHTGPELEPPLAAGPDTGVHWVPLAVPAVSSTDVRERAAAGGDLSSLVPEPVAHYIERYGLYRDEEGLKR